MVSVPLLYLFRLYLAKIIKDVSVSSGSNKNLHFIEINEMSCWHEKHLPIFLILVLQDLKFPPDDLLLRGEHRIPGRKLHWSLVQHFEHIGRYIFLLDHQTEHILIEPLVCHYQASLIS